MAARFPKLTESEHNCLIEQKTKTKKQRFTATKVAVNVFRQYLEKRKVNEKELLTSNIKPCSIIRG